ncbi:MAG: hypothetical protein QW153_04120 [Candidatus Bilamarchaeaceae archaeon]
MAFPAIAAAAAAQVGSKLMDKGIDYAFAKQTAKNNQKMYEKNQKTAFDLSQKAQQNAPLNEKIGARQAGFSTSFLNGVPQAAAMSAPSPGTQTNPQGGEPSINSAFKNQAAAQQNKLERRLLEAQVKTAENTASQSEIKTKQDTLNLVNSEDENRALTDSYKNYLQQMINNTDDPAVKAELESILENGSFTAGSLRGNKGFMEYIKQASDTDLAQAANQYQKQIAQQNIKNGNAAFIAAMPKQEFLTIVEKLKGLSLDNENKELTKEKLNAEILHLAELIQETAEKTDSIKHNNWYKMQKDKSSDYLTAQLLNQLSKDAPQMLSKAASDVIGLVKHLMPTSKITKVLNDVVHIDPKGNVSKTHTRGGTETINKAFPR